MQGRAQAHRGVDQGDRLTVLRLKGRVSMGDRALGGRGPSVPLSRAGDVCEGENEDG